MTPPAFDVHRTLGRPRDEPGPAGSTYRVAVAAGGFPGQKLVTLDAGSRGRGRSVVGQEEEGAVAVSDGGVLTLQPGHPLGALFRLMLVGTVAVREWVIDHG